MSSKLQKAEGGMRAVQLLLVGLFFIFWIYLRVNGFGTKWDTAPPGAETYGTIMFALGLIAALWGLGIASAGMAYVVRTHYAQHGLGFHLGRWGLELAAVWLFVGTRVMLTLAPLKFPPELTETSNARAEPTFSQIKLIAGFGVNINIFLFGVTHWLVLAQAFLSRRERKRNHNFGKLDGEEYGSSSALNMQTQASAYDSYTTKKPSFSTPNLGKGVFSKFNWGNKSQQQSELEQPPMPMPQQQQQQPVFHGQQASWGGSTQASFPQQTPTYGGYQPGYARPGVPDPPQTQQFQQQQQMPIYPGQIPQQQSYGAPAGYAQQQPASYHQRDTSIGTYYANVGGGRPSISPPTFQGQQNRF